MSTEKGTTPERIKIVLTNARPVRVSPDLWPVLAVATSAQHEGEYDFQSNRNQSWVLKVRQHAKGCAIVYGIYSHQSAWREERDIQAKCGLRVAKGGDLIQAINDVANLMEDAVEEDRPEDAKRFRALARECIGDLPVEDPEFLDDMCGRCGGQLVHVAGPSLRATVVNMANVLVTTLCPVCDHDYSVFEGDR